MNEMTTKERADFVRRFHKRVGGPYTTKELARMLGRHETTIRLYLRNEVATDSSYTPPQEHKLNAQVIRFLLSNGFHKTTIAKLFAVTRRTVDYKLAKESEAETCQAT